MGIVLKLLNDVRWRGTPVVGERPRALLAALVAANGRPVRTEELIELVWGEEIPTNATKSLQVLVSRTRSACGEQAIVSDSVGYRLGVKPAEVDSVRLCALVREARVALARDAAAAAALAREAIALAGGLLDTPDEDGGPLSEIRRAAKDDAGAANVILARALSRTGKHAEALQPLIDAARERPGDEALLTDLLHSETAILGPAAALERYEGYRRELRERLGTNPGAQLQRVQRELLALDQPVRGGLRYDSTPLLGRDADLEHLRALLASARVVSIVGPGGLGKTRLAHVLARNAALPVVHVVELAGVSAAEDVVGEVGSALGVRDSLGARRALTPEQRVDVRARIAQQLAQAPSLLVLDNCEHLVDAIAELVAFLVSSTADLRVLTTSRAALAIAAEHVYLLGQLDSADAVALFTERAVAARPGVQSDAGVVTRIVTRLDGLPLAIELAAAKVRVMSAEEIDRRLENRFALLRGGDRSAPDRHQTLLAVIDWSWNLLDLGARRALRRLSPFNDGFTLQAAGDVLGDGALDAVQALVDQSLLSVVDRPAGVRYRMLETVREFGRMQLVDTGEDAEANAARRAWAIGYASAHVARLAGAEQFAAIDALGAEEVNLADELRGALADGDIDAAVQLLAPLGMFWMIRGEHVRLVTLATVVSEAVGDWYPPPELENIARAAISIVLSNAMFAGEQRASPLRGLLERLGHETGGDGRLSGTVRVVLAFDQSDPGAFRQSLEALAQDPDRGTALAANQWLCYALENGGDPQRAIAVARRGLDLIREEDGPWYEGLVRNQLAQLSMNVGDRSSAAEHARASLPIIARLGARDDEIQLHSLLAMCAIADGRPQDADAELAEIERIAEGATGLFGGIAVWQIGRAELLLERGEREAGLALHRECVERMRAVAFPGIPRTGLEPWGLFGEATALAAHAHHACTDAELAYGKTLFTATRDHAVASLEADNVLLDFPVAGLLAFGLGAWAHLRDAAPVQDAARLLILAERFAYNRMIPSMMWERIAPGIEAAAPGLLDRFRDTYGKRPPEELLDDARRTVEQLPR
ncbi:MAG: BTAD domain-containing putative transcriptional regulator [Solirubrobacteraceae bacterium]